MAHVQGFFLSIWESVAFKYKISDNFCHWLFVVVEELYGGLTEQSIEETIRSACLEDQEYLSIKQDVTRLFS